MDTMPDYGETGEQGTLDIVVHLVVPEDAALKYDLQARIERLVDEGRTVSAKVDLTRVDSSTRESVITLTYTAMTYPLPPNRKATIHGQEIIGDFLQWLSGHHIVHRVDDEVVIKLNRKEANQ